jgi:hypothetical protein
LYHTFFLLCNKSLLLVLEKCWVFFCAARPNKTQTQLSALGARRHFFRNPRRMRALRAGMSPNELDEEMMAGPGFGYFSGK